MQSTGYRTKAANGAESVRPLRARSRHKNKKVLISEDLLSGAADGTRTRGLRRDRPAL